MQIINDYYLANPHVKRDGIKESFTQEQLAEYARCMKDPIYFCEKYCKVIHPDRGLVPFELYPYQKSMFKNFLRNRYNIVLSCRQSGKSISACAFLLWYALFHQKKNVAVIANRGDTAREMLGRITLMLENIPFFLQPGCKKLNASRIHFSNESKIMTAATTSSSIRGHTINLLYMDEFAFVENDAKFYTSTYPVISAGTDTKVIITSTANGVGNMFHKLWEGAVQKINNFVPFRVDWWSVPGRDEKWKNETIANTSQMQFDQEFSNSFIGTGDTLISAEALLKLRARAPKRTLENGNLSIYEDTIPGHEYIMMVDVSGGKGQDYSTFNVVDVTARPFKQVAVYRNNYISPILFPTVIYKYATLYNSAYVIIESNDAGAVVCAGLWKDLEYENMHIDSALKSKDLGIRMTVKTKKIGCSGIKDLVESNRLEINDASTIDEMSTFQSSGNSFEASTGNHDDLMMNFVMLGYFINTQKFLEITDIDIKKMMFDQRIKDIEDDVPPFGFIELGMDDVAGEIARIEEEENGRIWPMAPVNWPEIDGQVW